MAQARALPTRRSSTSVLQGRLRARLLAGLLILAAGLLAAAPARADHDDDVYCEVHDGYFAPAHFERHPDGYVVLAHGAHRFYPRPAYSTLVVDYWGRPAVYVSGGHFYPLWVGYGPIYQPVGYFGVLGGHFGSTHLGLRIGLHALPTIGYGFLSYRPTVVHYRARPHHYYYRAWAAPPHVHHRGHLHRGHTHHPRHKVWKFD